MLYAAGHGMPADPAQARDWMTKAAADGNDAAKAWLEANKS
jgi:TPR repeat protein